MATCPACGKSMLSEWPHAHPKPRPIIEREALLGECLSRFRLALTAHWLHAEEECRASEGEVEDILTAAIALLVSNGVVDPQGPTPTDLMNGAEQPPYQAGRPVSGAMSLAPIPPPTAREATDG